MSAILTWVESSSSLEISDEIIKLKSQITDLNKRVIAANLDAKAKTEERNIWCSLAKKWLIESNKEINLLQIQASDLNVNERIS